MKLRNVEKLKLEAKVYKNIKAEIKGKSVAELKPELSETITKLVTSWNAFFESNGRTPVMKPQNKTVEKDVKQTDEPVFEQDEMEYLGL